LLLSLIGAIGSVSIALVGMRLLSAINPNSIRAGSRIGALGMVTFDAIRFDSAALLFTLGAAIAVGLAFGLAPALFATRASVAAVLKDDGRERAGRIGLTRLAARRLLVVAEISLALILLVGSGLMIRSLANLLAVNVGADMKNVLTAQFTVPPRATAYDSLPTLYGEIVRRMGALPGVTSASIGDCAPLGGRCRITMVTKDPVLTPDMSRLAPAGIRWVTPESFTTLRISLRAGRVFTPDDRPATPKVIMVNEAAAKRFWPSENPIGKRLALGQGGMDSGATVIGVVADVRHRIDSVAMPTVYVSYYQVPWPGGMIFIRATNAVSLSADVRRVLHELAPRYPVYDIQLLTSRTTAATAQARFSAVLLGAFAAVALTLAMVGIYGVMALTVTQRTHEIGIRMALGADRSRVRGMIVGEGATLMIIGATIGVLGAAAITRALSSLLFGVRPFDPVTYAALVGLVATAAIAASWLPARSATLVNPTEALRGG
jgi:putative ABC transport system permease protein